MTPTDHQQQSQDQERDHKSDDRQKDQNDANNSPADLEDKQSDLNVPGGKGLLKEPQKNLDA